MEVDDGDEEEDVDEFAAVAVGITEPEVFVLVV